MLLNCEIHCAEILKNAKTCGMTLWKTLEMRFDSLRRTVGDTVALCHLCVQVSEPDSHGCGLRAISCGRFVVLNHYYAPHLLCPSKTLQDKHSLAFVQFQVLNATCKTPSFSPTLAVPVCLITGSQVARYR